MQLARVTIKKGRDKSILRGNPWIFSGSVKSIDNFERNGQLCEIVSSQNDFLAIGYVNPESNICCRILAWKQIPVDRNFIEGKMLQAVSFRTSAISKDTDAYRLVNSEGDFLPGLVIDRYGDGVVIQILTCGMELLRDNIISAVRNILKPSFIVERSDTASRLDEGLDYKCEILFGSVPDLVEIMENGIRFRVDLLRGQKTGFYLDQRDSRFLIRRFCSGKRVLNLFSYTGGFSAAAASAQASEVTSVDSSEAALRLAKENMEINGYGSLSCDYIKADVFDYLDSSGDLWDVIVLDPPAFASKKASVEKAARGYKDINLRALKKLNPGGVLATFSCSHHITPVLFGQIVYAAVSDSGRKAQIITRTAHQPDHPVNVCHREGEYLKGIFLRVIE